MSNILVVIIVFGGLVFFHELGHFLVARLFGVGVKTFSVGFGPTLFARVRGKTKYQIAAIPLGGYVALVGETSDADLPKPFTKEESLALRPAWQRFCIIAAGAIFNFILAWVVFSGMYFTWGELVVEPIATRVVEDSPAFKAGILAEDRIIRIDGKPIATWQDMLTEIQFSQGRELAVTVQRKDVAPFDVKIAPVLLETESPAKRKQTMWSMGIVGVSTGVKDYSIGSAFVRGAEEIVNVVKMTFRGLSGLITRQLPADSMQGPLGIGQTIYEQAEGGLFSTLKILALLSVALGTFNLLPIPVLDGGHLLFLTIEMVFRKPVPIAWQEKAMLAGLALLLTVMLFATYNDAMNFL